MMLILIWPYITAVFLARMVMPFSRSRSPRSRISVPTCSCSRKTCDCFSRPSTSVVLPWSTCAMIATLRMSCRVASVIKRFSPWLEAPCRPARCGGASAGQTKAPNVSGLRGPLSCGAIPGDVLHMIAQFAGRCSSTRLRCDGSAAFNLHPGGEVAQVRPAVVAPGDRRLLHAAERADARGQPREHRLERARALRGGGQADTGD